MNRSEKAMWPGELALLAAVCIDSFAVVLMLYSQAGIPAISSVSYALNRVIPQLSLGTWAYLFQLFLVLILMVVRKKFVPLYLISFVVGFLFSKLLDVHEAWIGLLPEGLLWRLFYFLFSCLLLSCAIALANLCQLPIPPYDLFPRELSKAMGVSYSRVKIAFDSTCLLLTMALTCFFLGRIEGVGVGTFAAALTVGKAADIIGKELKKHFTFEPFFKRTASH